MKLAVCFLPLLGLSYTVIAEDLADNIERLEIRGRQINTLGHSTSASEDCRCGGDSESTSATNRRDFRICPWDDSYPTQWFRQSESVFFARV